MPVIILTIITLAFLRSPGTSDVAVHWLPWMDSIATRGLVSGYQTDDMDYPPLISVFLWLAYGIGELLGAEAYLGLKILLTGFLFMTSAVLWLWTRDGVVTAALHLSLVLSSVALGYLDIFWAPAFLLALWALANQRFALFAVSYCAASLTKWQPLIIAPFLLVYILKTAGLRRAALHVVLPALLIVGGTYAVYGESALVSFERGLGHGFLSAQALNYGWVLTHALHLFDPADYGPLNDGECTLVGLFPDTPVMTVLRLLFWITYDEPSDPRSVGRDHFRINRTCSDYSRRNADTLRSRCGAGTRDGGAV
jgi:hypothetical protein